MFDYAEVYSIAFQKARTASELTIQMDVDPLTGNQMKLNPKQNSKALE